MIYFVIILLLTNVFRTLEETERSKSKQRRPFAALVFSSTSNITPSDKESCQWLKRLKYQRKLCWKVRGLSQVLHEARYLSVAHCQAQFEFDQWNCSNRDYFFNNLYRETAFMHSIASSAVMYSVAKACAEGTLAGCTCGENKKARNDEKWQRKCSDNTKYAKRFTSRFLQLKKMDDGFNAVTRYNSEVGIRVVLENESTKCKCHGVSGSCNVEVCWKEVRPFENIAKQLKLLYHNAVQVQPQNNLRSFKVGKTAEMLLYLDDSPNFCKTTLGRECNSPQNCATVCCGKGHNSEIREIKSKCCVFNTRIYNLTCETCVTYKTILTCK